LAATTTRRGIEIFFDTVGAGPGLVLIHGITESMRVWDPLVPQLAEDHRVLLVDLPGHGQSEAESDYAVTLLADDVADAVTAAGLERAMIVGHSLGGIVATAFAATYPTRAVVNVDQPLDLAGFQDLVRQLAPALRGDEATFQATMAAVFDAMYGRLSGPARSRVEALRSPKQDVVLAVWAPLLDAPAEMLDELVRQIGQRVRAPYLSLHGTDPGATYATWLPTVLPRAEVEVWPGLGHYPHLVEPERFVARLRQFDQARAQLIRPEPS